MRFDFLTVVSEVLKVVFDVSAVLCEFLRVVLEIFTVVNSCGCVSSNCVRGFAFVSVESLIPSSVCLLYTSDHFESTTLTTVKAPREWHLWRAETYRRRLFFCCVYIPAHMRLVLYDELC